MEKRCGLCEGTGKIGFQQEDCWSCFGEGYINIKEQEERTCSNCYYLHKSHIHNVYFCASHEASKEKPDKICDKHLFCCSSSECLGEAEYKYNNKLYCVNCLFEELDVEQCTTIEYYKDGEYLGSEDDIVEVIENLNEDITML